MKRDRERKGEARPRTPCARAAWLAGAAGFVLLPAGPALAETNYRADFGANYAHDDNLFRQDSNLPGATGKRADDIYSATGDAAVTAKFGSYTADVEASAGYNRYRRNRALDNFGYAVSGALTREQDGVVGLTVNALSQRQLSSFADTRLQVRNIQSLNRVNGVVTVPITPELRLVAAPDFIQSTNSGPFISTNDYRQYGSGVGVGYFTPLGNSIAVTVTRRQTDGLEDRTVLLAGVQTDARIDAVDTLVDLRLTYNPSPITRIDGIVSYQDRNDKSPIDNDYHGPSGRVTVSYMPRETLRAQVVLERQLGSPGLLFIDSLKTDQAQARIDADVSGRWRLHALASYQARRYSFDPVAGVNQPGRTDKDWTFRLDNGYAIANRVEVGMSVAHNRRDSTVAFGDFHSTTVQLSLSVLLGNGDRRGSLY